MIYVPQGGGGRASLIFRHVSRGKESKSYWLMLVRKCFYQFLLVGIDQACSGRIML